ncbi:hypothetical protein TNCV_1863481 [Trichonephila clavipes]|nr:hypothetical protein TNCV_1863481 [Trichonephila clavipes]
MPFAKMHCAYFKVRTRKHLGRVGSPNYDVQQLFKIGERICMSSKSRLEENTIVHHSNTYGKHEAEANAVIAKGRGSKNY